MALFIFFLLLIIALFVWRATAASRKQALEIPRPVLPLRVTQVGEYLGLPYVEISYKEDPINAVPERIWCARSLIEHPVSDDHTQSKTTVEIMHIIAARHGVTTTGVVTESLKWEDGAKRIELDFNFESLLFCTHDELTDPGSNDVRFFIDETESSLDVMIKLDEGFFIEGGGLDDQQLRDYLAHIPEALLHRIKLFCKCTRGDILLMGTEFMIRADYGAIDLELVDAFLAECAKFIAEIPAPPSDSQESLW